MTAFQNFWPRLYVIMTEMLNTTYAKLPSVLWLWHPTFWPQN